MKAGKPGRFVFDLWVTRRHANRTWMLEEGGNLGGGGGESVPEKGP